MVDYAKKVAAICEAFGVRNAWQDGGDCDPINQLANYHIDLTIPSFGIQEENHFPPLVHEMMPGCAELKGGYLYASDAPGLGIDIKEELAAKYPLEPLPLVDLKRVEVKMALIKAALSGGKDVEIRSAVIDGLTVNIVKMPDGTTNLERLQHTLSSETKPAEPAQKKESDLSFLRVDHAALHDGKIALVDKDRQLSVQHLDVEVNDLRAGKPLEVVLKAAVLTEKQNLELHVKAAPLPPSLTPTPTTLVFIVLTGLY